MKHCEEYAALLSAFADGEMSGQEREEVLAHLENCEACRDYLADLMAVKDELSAPVPELPENFSQQVMWRVRSEKTKKAKKSRRKMATAVASAAACLVLVLAIPYVLGGVGMSDSAAESTVVMEDSAAEDMVEEDALMDDVSGSITDGGTNDVVNDCETPAAGKTESDGFAVSREQMDLWLAENETMTFRTEEAEEETVYHLDREQYESFRAFMESQGVFMGEMGENETVTIYVR